MQKLRYCTNPKPQFPHPCPHGHPPFCRLPNGCSELVEPYCWTGHYENRGYCQGHKPVNVPLADRDMKIMGHKFHRSRSAKRSPINFAARLGNYSADAIAGFKSGRPILREKLPVPLPHRPSPLEGLYSEAANNFPPLPPAAQSSPQNGDSKFLIY